MKLPILISTFIMINFGLSGQSLSDSSKTDVAKWIHTYYKDPKPDSLYLLYCIRVVNAEGKAPNIPFLGFVASALKKDVASLMLFYIAVSKTSNRELVESFGWILWYINSEESKKMLIELANHPNQKKNKSFLVATRKKKPIDITKDDLVFLQPTMLWSEFFATGNRETVYLLLSKIDNYESSKWVEKQVAMKVVNDIRFLAKEDQQITEYCKDYMNVSNEPTKSILKELITDIESGKKF